MILIFVSGNEVFVSGNKVFVSETKFLFRKQNIDTLSSVRVFLPQESVGALSIVFERGVLSRDHKTFLVMIFR